MAYKDLRGWLEKMDEMNELVRINGAHWNLEAGAVTALAGNRMVLFDEFPGYPPGYRVLASSSRDKKERFFVTANWSTEAEGLALTRAWLDRLREFKPVPPKWVDSGPIKENIIRGDDVDVLRFPVPIRHEKEAGRYIGTGHTVILKDPDTGRINLGTYRMQVHDGKTLGIHASEGKDGRIILDRYKELGKPCPIVAMVGIDPATFFASIAHCVHLGDVTELDFLGWLKGQPEEIFAGEFTGLPILANAEIAIEGEIPPDKLRMEGPFAEWVGYCQPREFPFVNVKTIYHRNDPILTVALGEGSRPPGKAGLRSDFRTAAMIWDQMERAGVRGIKGVASNSRRLIVVSIKNMYAGQSRQAGLIASQCHAGAYGNAWVIVVDEDIDPNNTTDVLWAVLMRTEPKRALQVLEYCWASHLIIQDPSYVQKADYAMRPEKATYMSRVIIDACKPLEWAPSWHEDVHIKPELKVQALKKWGDILGSGPTPGDRSVVGGGGGAV
ncbi:MAG: UbiD family decarboxylase [Desulfobacterales bacterium]|nr:UbiD family decarboxylase [Desulfobacterales bacterium]